MRRTTLMTAICALALSNLAAFAQNDRPRNLILFVPDGMRALMVKPDTAPVMAALRDKGVNFANSHSLFPTFTTANATQVGGNHYASKAIQPWDAMQAWLSREAFIGYLHGNALKYMARWQDKGGIEDVKKARHYIDKLIEVLEQP